MRLWGLAAALLCFSAGPVLAGAWEDALAAHDAGRYEEALKLLAPLGATGNVDAQNKLSHMYWYGEGTPVDYAAALNWSRAAAQAGSASAFYDIGVHYKTGNGLPQSDANAFASFEKAAELGDPRGARSVAVMYMSGTGVAPDIAKFGSWMQIAADRGDPLAQFLLASAMIGQGQRDEADRLLQGAASQNLAEAQFLLGRMFLDGDYGWPLDPAQAYMWLKIAAASGCLEGPALAKRAIAELTAEQQAESATLVTMWQEANPIEPGHVHPIKPRACDSGAEISS
jgi:TPR repeat protein